MLPSGDGPTIEGSTDGNANGQEATPTPTGNTTEATEDKTNKGWLKALQVAESSSI